MDQKIVWEAVLLPNGIQSRYLADFEELEFIGNGAFGAVAKCKKKSEDQVYAVKKILLERKQLTRLFSKVVREVEIMAALDHTNVVRFYQAWLEPSLPGSYCHEEHILDEDARIDVQSPCLYILMEHCARSLETYLSEFKNSYSLKDAMQIFGQIVAGVAYIHGSGYIHQDLSPRNIFLDKDGIIKIGDFGLAEKLDEDGSVPLSALWPPIPYRAPEYKRGEPVDAKADIFSLGLILAELLHPFEDETERSEGLKRVRKKFRLPRHWQVVKFAGLCNLMISKYPFVRPTADEILEVVRGNKKTLKKLKTRASTMKVTSLKTHTMFFLKAGWRKKVGWKKKVIRKKENF